MSSDSKHVGGISADFLAGIPEQKFERVEVDPFTTKRAQEITRETHFGHHRVHKDAAEEFGRRVAWAVKEGLPFEVAFEAAKEHYRVFGQAMIDTANMVQAEMLTRTPAREAPDGK